MSEQETAPTTALETQKGTAKRSLSLLASEMFGSEFKGEVKTEAEPEDSKNENTESEDGTGENDDAGGVEEDKVKTGEEDETSGEETDETPISSVSELVESLEADPDWFGTLKMQVKVDGKPAEATIADLVKSYQIGEAADHRLEEAKSKAKSITEDLAKQSEDLKGQFAQVAKLIESAESLLDQDVKAIDWNKLRDEDPAEYSARKADMTDRRERIEQLKRGAVTAWKQGNEKAEAEQSERLKSYLQSEHAALLEKLPEWRDEAKAKADKAKLAEYLLKQGFTEEDVMGASDHRLILVARKAMLYDEGQSKVNAARKKVAKVPKVMKPGASRPDDQRNQERIDQARARLQKSGSLNDAFVVLKAKRGGK